MHSLDLLLTIHTLRVEKKPLSSASSVESSLASKAVVTSVNNNIIIIVTVLIHVVYAPRVHS